MFKSQIVSIDIGSYTTKVVAGFWNGKKIQVEREILEPTPEEAYNDGHLENLDVIAEFLDTILKANRLKKAALVFTTDSTEIIMREMIVPAVSEKELRSMLPFEVDKVFPVKNYDYVAEYQVLEEIEREGVKTLRLQVAIMPEVIVERYWELANRLKMKPLGLDLHPSSCAKLFAQSIQNGDKEESDLTVALIDGGHSKIRFSIISSGKLEFSRAALRGGKELDESMALNFEISKAEANAWKTRGNLIEGFTSEDTQLLRINQVIQSKVDEWLMEIQPTIRYYLGLKETNKIDKIVIAGGLAEIPGVASYIQEVFNRPTSVIAEVKIVERNTKESATKMCFLVNAIGSLIQE